MTSEARYKTLIADDDPISRRILENMLVKWGYEVTAAVDGEEAWDIIEAEQPRMALLDWMMPGMDGPTLCRRIRERKDMGYIYVILLTVKDRLEDRISGLESGADDYVTKPYSAAELRSRINVGWRIVELERALADKVSRLEESLAQVKRLQRLLPICSYCHKVRNDSDYWQEVESYIAEHSEVRFTHGICPDCYREHVAPQLEDLREGDEKGQ